MATFVADVPVNAAVSIPPLGAFDVVCEAGEPFHVPDGPIADAFLERFGPQPRNANVSTANRERGRIAGLRRVKPDAG